MLADRVLGFAIDAPEADVGLEPHKLDWQPAGGLVADFSKRSKEPEHQKQADWWARLARVA
jgi:hypothetical protein